ncbi:acyltransferase family protein [Sinomonas terrae]|uniref:Acyltransferase n=1 Tax=Sinomonas terrae TaxID=2908838 RepID=A0ABS9U6I8_9MICC|nr:acyltransferase [Sinomonas terrae]MCH6472151.1 acyltransferase [Sinomonas terrae]
MKRIHSLTGLRFLAASAVALMHGFARYDLPVVNLGFLGVSFFFVLSGFVLTWAETTADGTVTFLRNRFAKLFPLNAATLAVAAIVPVAPNSSRLSFLQSLTLTQAWRPSSASSFNAVAWSLSAEAFFYLLLPAMLRVMRRFNVRELVGTVVFLMVLQPVMGLVFQLTLGGGNDGWAAHFLTYDFPPYRMAEFVIGVALALLLKAGHAPSRTSQLTAAAVTTAGIALTLLADLSHLTLWWASEALILPAIIVLVWATARRELEGRSCLLTHPRIVRLGDRSFSFYMVHYLVLGAVGLLVAQGPQSLPWWLVPPALLSAAAVAALAYRFVEKPCERAIRDLFAVHRFGSTAPRPASEPPRPLEGQSAEVRVRLRGRNL